MARFFNQSQSSTNALWIHGGQTRETVFHRDIKTPSPVPELSFLPSLYIGAEPGRAKEESRGLFLQARGNYRDRQAVLSPIPDEGFKSFENCTVKLSAKETKWTSLEV